MNNLLSKAMKLQDEVVYELKDKVEISQGRVYMLLNEDNRLQDDVKWRQLHDKLIALYLTKKKAFKKMNDDDATKAKAIDSMKSTKKLIAIASALQNDILVRKLNGKN